MRKALCVFAALAVGIALASPARSESGRQHWQVQQPTRFIVTGVMRKDVTTDEIKLKPVHGIITADTQAEAERIFSQDAKHDYPGYTLIEMFSTLVPVVGTCNTSI